VAPAAARPRPAPEWSSAVRAATPLRILVVGSHPDDVEIGAGALVLKSVELGAEVHVLVLTDEPDSGRTRRTEAVLGARELGVPPERVLFAGLVDGHLRADRDSVRAVRELMAARGVDPDVVVTHTQADSHTDHVEANRIAHAAFRGRVFLHYSIHLSSESDRFAPRVFVEVTGDRLAAKGRALAAHGSQSDRIGKADLADHEAALGRLARLARAEAFEVGVQNNAFGILEKTVALSDSPFHRLWTPIVGEAGITLLYEAYSAPGETIDWPTVHENAGRDRLRSAFAARWTPASPLREKFSNSPDAEDLARRAPVVLAGGGVSNPVVRHLYNRLRDTLWAIEYDLPRTEPAYLLNRATGRRVYPEFADGRRLVRDAGLVAVVPNPWAPEHRIVAACGASGYATRVGLEFLADPGSRPDLAGAFLDHPSTQVAFTVDAADGRLELLDVSHGGFR